MKIDKYFVKNCKCLNITITSAILLFLILNEFILIKESFTLFVCVYLRRTAKSMAGTRLKMFMKLTKVSPDAPELQNFIFIVRVVIN